MNRIHEDERIGKTFPTPSVTEKGPGPKKVRTLFSRKSTRKNPRYSDAGSPFLPDVRMENRPDIPPPVVLRFSEDFPQLTHLPEKGFAP
ncbi:hypothetical protein LptCag_2520 [Leptospirillum ferriphilum]|uniref:Uncharacterized protein n=1 Tax=Leptospirillum ferriphilum TaxID=178606 RepID=A0A094YPD3_9BACT|nr:hypothetical protein ABH19_01800 [Leptospirillum sp. Group II 'CF-1']KGA95086.1 hypothetical protein LptCag_2520 [Leptospirillum ferriphilum]